MSKVFFTGCTHFDHANIIGLANRPFTSVDEMNEVMVENWNKTVKPNDEVFHLGDVVYGRSANSAGYWFSKLNGRKTVILGNHDEGLDFFNSDAGVKGVQNYCDLKRGGKHFILFHYPMEDWDRRYKGSIHLHCHTHQTALERPSLPHIYGSGLSGHPNDTPGLVLPAKYPADQFCNRFNVTVEATGYKPISMDEILHRSQGGSYTTLEEILAKADERFPGRTRES